VEHEHPAPAALSDPDRLERLEADLARTAEAMTMVDGGDLDGFDLAVAPLLDPGAPPTLFAPGAP
jgi:hypothetical protein